MSAPVSDTAAPSAATAPAPSASAKPPGLADLLAVRPYVAVWFGRTLCAVAVSIQATSLAWQVYAVARAHGSVNEAAFAVGMLGLAQFLPMAGFTLLAGDTADRYNRRAVIVCSLGVIIGCSLGFCATAWLGLKHVWPLYALGAVFGAARAFYTPSIQALAPTLVPRPLLPRAIVMTSSGTRLAQITGPAIGGVLVAISPLLAFGASLALLLLSLSTTLFYRAPPPPGVSASRTELIGEGLAYIWSNKVVLGAISLDLFAVLLGGATALLPVFARDILHIGAQGFGVLRAAPAVGALLSGFVIAARPVKSHVGIKMFLAVAGFGLATIVFAVSRSMVLSILALMCLGASDMISVFVRQSLIQIVTPDHMRGRVAAVSVLFISGSNELGEFESGGVARFLGPVGSALFGGIGSITVTGLWAWLFPDLRKANRLV
jgi:MFS family permease